MKYPYIKFPSADPKRRWIARPLIPIRVIGPKGKWEGYGLIDSGADKSLFNIEIAKDIGLNLEYTQIENFSGIEGGRLKAKLVKVKIQIMGMEEVSELTVGVVESSVVGVILGQDGFFDAYRVKFEKDLGIVEVTKVPD